MTERNRKIVLLVIGLLLLFTPAIVAMYLFATNASSYSLFYRNGMSFTDLATLQNWSYISVAPPFTLGAIILSNLLPSGKPLGRHDV